MNDSYRARSAVLSSCVLAVLASAMASAQTQSDEPKPPPPPSAETKAAVPTQEKELGEIVVTGSRVRRTAFDSQSPILVITREETMLAGFNSTTEALQDSAVTGGTAQINNAFGGFVTDGGPGANTLGLRGLGAGRTLVLLNGRRVAPAGSRGSVGSADLNVLPSAMVDRVEVLRDGASSIYGSDAIAGVVNILTRTDLEGLTIEGQHNGTVDGGGEQTRFSLVGGMSGEGFHFGGSLEYYERQNLTLGDRDWTQCNQDYLFNPDGTRSDYVDPNTGAFKCYTIAGGTGSNGVTINTLGTPAQPGVPATGNPTLAAYNRWRPNADVTTGLVGYEGVSGGSLNVRDTFDPRMLNRSLISPAEIYTAFFEGGYELRALGNAEIYGEALAHRRESDQTGFRQLSLDYPQGSPLIPPNLAFAARFAPPSAITTPNNIGVRAFIGFGNYETAQELDFLKGTVGLRGDLFIDGWRYDAYVSYAESDATYRIDSWLTDRLRESLQAVAAPAGTDPALVRDGRTCAVNLTNPARRCILAPALTPAVIGGVLPQDWIDFTWVKDQGKTVYDETVATFNIDGPLFMLPAGMVRGAFGLEYREASIDDTPSVDSQNGNLYNLTSAAITRGSDSVGELYAEFELPLLGNMTAIKALSLNLSGRYTDYESYGSDETYKVGLAYTATDWLSFRGTYGTSYRAPALFEQFLGATSGFLSSTGDPCNNWDTLPAGTRRTNCQSEGLPAGFVQTSSIRVDQAGGADQGLEAETSDNLTVGLILQPTMPESWGSLAFAVDYYDIQIDNGVDRAGASNLLPLCYDDPDFRAGGGYCRYIAARPPANTLTVFDSYTNIATQIVEGIDYTVRYERGIGAGTMLANLQFTQYLSQKNRLFSDEPFDEYNGNIASPEYTSTLVLTYTWDAWRVRYGLEWIASMNSNAYLEVADDNSDGFDFDVPDYYLQDLSAEYRNDDQGWTAIVGIRNIADKTPAWISSGFYDRVGNAPLYSGYDYVGRQVFVNFSMSF